MANVEAWVKLLYTYGPFALLVVFLFVAEKKARDSWKAAPAKDKHLCAMIYSCNWFVIFGLVVFAGYAWYQINFLSEATIRGSLGTLEGSETVASDTANLFLHRIYGDRKGHFRYEWRLISSKRLADGAKIVFTLDRSTNESEWVKDYELTMRSSFYQEDVPIFYDRRSDKLVVKHGSKVEELPAVEKISAAQPAKVATPLIKMAYASETFSPSEFSGRLQSNDPIIRRDARTDLANRGAAAFPWIQQVLADTNSSYRIRLGVISALNQMRGKSVDALSPATIEGIIDSSAHPDATLRAEARRFLVTHASWNLETQIDRTLTGARSQKTVGSAVSKRVPELVRTEFEILYNLGVLEKDKYGSKRAEDRPRINKAITAFQKAWALRTLASPADRVIFPKGLYGWGHALHDRSWIERRPDGTRDPVMVRAAQEKFSEFLREVQRMDSGNTYPFPKHVKQAEAYIKNPIPESLQV